MRDRDYQREAVDAAFSEWDRGVRATMIVAATGTGKTVIAGRIVNRILEQGGDILFLVHREELLQQTYKAFREMTDVPVAREGSQEFKEATDSSRIVVAMVQSMRSRFKRMNPDRYQALFYDECHHAPAKSWMNVLHHFTGVSKVLGLTATPKRGDGVAMGKVFDSVAYEFPIVEAVDQGWLVPFRSRVVTCNELDLRRIRLTAGEYNQKELRRQLTKQAVVDRIATQSIEIADGRQTVIFCQTVEQSEAVRRVLQIRGERAVHLDGKIPKHVRRARMQEFSNGDARFITNCAVIEEGVSINGIECVANARPTRSQTRIVQSIGRGLRPLSPPVGETAKDRREEIANSDKPFCTVIDLVGQIGSRSMCFSGDLLGGDFGDEVRREALEIAKKIKGDINWTEVYKEAQERVANREAVAEVSSRDKEKAWMYRYHPDAYTILGMSKSEARQKVSNDEAVGKPMIDALRFLEGEGLKIHEYNRLASTEQLFLARQIWKRNRGGMPTFKQSRWLHKLGYGTNISKREASSIMNRAAENGWLRPESDGPNLVYLADTGQDGSLHFNFDEEF